MGKVKAPAEYTAAQILTETMSLRVMVIAKRMLRKELMMPPTM